MKFRLKIGNVTRARSPQSSAINASPSVKWVRVNELLESSHAIVSVPYSDQLPCFHGRIGVHSALSPAHGSCCRRNLFLGKQLGLYIERKIKPRRATDSIRFTLARLSRWFDWQEALIVVKPTGGDSFVQFRSSDAIRAGDIFVTTGYPVIDLKNGGSIQGVLNGLNHILDLAIPDYRMEGGTWIIPGAGRLSDSADVADYRDMLTIIRDRVADMIGKNVTLRRSRQPVPPGLTIRVTAATRAHGLPRCSSKLSIAVSGPENRPP